MQTLSTLSMKNIAMGSKGSEKEGDKREKGVRRRKMENRK
jgi:hypothetical protein